MVFDKKIYQPRFTVKQDATSLNPFHSFAGPLGIFKHSELKIFNHLPPKAVNRRYFDVESLKTLAARGQHLAIPAWFEIHSVL